MKLRVVALVLRHRQLRAGALGLRLGGGEGGLLGIEKRLADQPPLQHFGVAVALGPGQRELGLGGAELGAHGVGLQGQIPRIELCQHLALAHARAGVDEAARDLAADPERQRRLLARAHFAGKNLQRRRRRLRLHHDRGPGRRAGVVIRSASRQRQHRQSERQSQRRAGGKTRARRHTGHP